MPLPYLGMQQPRFHMGTSRSVPAPAPLGDALHRWQSPRLRVTKTDLFLELMRDAGRVQGQPEYKRPRVVVPKAMFSHHTIKSNKDITLSFTRLDLI